MDDGAYGLIGAGINAAVGAAEGKANREHQLQMQQNQFDYGIKTMGLQHSYNESSANAADQRTRALYNDLQSPQAMVEQLKAAGLNPALMYSNMAGGAGGSVPHGAQGQGSGLPGAGGASGNPFFPIDLAGAFASIRSANAQAEAAEGAARKSNAEADVLEGKGPTGERKIATLDQTIANLAADTENKKAQKGLTDAQTRLAGIQTSINELQYEIGEATKEDTIHQVAWQTEKMWQEVYELQWRNYITSESAREMIKAWGIQNEKTASEIAKNYANVELTEAQCQEISNVITKLQYEAIESKWRGINESQAYEKFRDQLEQAAVFKDLDIDSERKNTLIRGLFSLAGFGIYGAAKRR